MFFRPSAGNRPAFFSFLSSLPINALPFLKVIAAPKALPIDPCRPLICPFFPALVAIVSNAHF